MDYQIAFFCTLTVAFWMAVAIGVLVSMHRTDRAHIDQLWGDLCYAKWGLYPYQKGPGSGPRPQGLPGHSNPPPPPKPS